MALRPCVECGVACESTRCPKHAREHAHDIERNRHRLSARRRGYTKQYERARAVVLFRSRVCWICGKPGADTADHVIPLSQGGNSTIPNLRPAHGRCNSVRGGQQQR